MDAAETGRFYPLLELEQWADVLRKHGYRVVPEERVRRLTVPKAISLSLLESMRPGDIPSFQRYCDDAVACSIGDEMVKTGAITKTAIGGMPGLAAVEWRYTAHVILPRPA